MHSINVPLQFCKKIGNDIWFPADAWNSLYKYDISEKKMQWIGEFQKENTSIFEIFTLFTDVQVYGTKIFFVPYAAKRMHIYDIETGVFESLEIPTESKNLLYFTQGVIFDGNMYLIGFEYKGILKLNLETYEFESINEWAEELDRQFGIKEDQGLIGRESVLVGHRLFMPCLQNNVIIEMDMRDYQYQFHIVGNKEDKYASIHKLEDELLLITCDRKLICWGEKQISEIEVNWKITPQYKLICHRNEEIWLFSTCTLEYLKVDIRSKEVISYKMPNLENDCIMYAKTKGQSIYFSTFSTGEWYRIDEHDKIEKLPDKLKEPRESFVEEHINEISQQQVIYERSWFPLEYFIRKVVIAGENHIVCERYDNIGIKIYKNNTGIE